MTNIWAGIYKEIRDPFFDMNDPYVMSEEKKEKEESKEKKSEKEDDDKPKRWWDDDGDGVGYEKGEVSGKFSKKKVKKEEVEQVDEAQVANRDPDKYEREQENKYAPVRGERTPMPPRGNKRREDFEKWYRANVKEERELHSRNNKNERLDWRKGIKNKIDVNPKEELEAWIQELLAEGFDLSKFTLDEVAEIYESAEVEDLDEAGSYDMPAKGDAETVRPDPLESAKRRAAQAQVRKELSDLQVAKARATAKLTPASEAVINYVGTRKDLFEARFDPKKSRLRPASERTKNAMTDAQRAAAKKEAQRTAEIHSKGETVLAGLRPQGKKGKVQTTPAPKPKAPEANRTVRGREDKLASAADKVLKKIKNK